MERYRINFDRGITFEVTVIEGIVRESMSSWALGKPWLETVKPFYVKRGAKIELI